jgi:hypothetical protein
VGGAGRVLFVGCYRGLCGPQRGPEIHRGCTGVEVGLQPVVSAMLVILDWWQVVGLWVGPSEPGSVALVVVEKGH